MRVEACGVCHSDLHIWQGYFDLGDGRRVSHADRGCTLPFTLGHEIVGEVAALGPDAEGAAVGERRIVFPWIGCGACEACAAGDENLCPKPRSLGARVNGGYSDHVMVPHGRYLVDFDGVDEDLACTYACSGLTAYGALTKVKHLGGRDHVVVIGAGGVGLSAIQIAPSVTEANVIVADLDATKREAGLGAGARHAVDNGSADAVQESRTSPAVAPARPSTSSAARPRPSSDSTCCDATAPWSSSASTAGPCRCRCPCSRSSCAG